MTFDISPKNQKIIYINKAGKNIEGFFVFFFLLSYLVCSQIWLNHLMDDHHFSYIYITTKLTQKKKNLSPQHAANLNILSYMSMKAEQLCKQFMILTLSQNTYVLTTEHAQAKTRSTHDVFLSFMCSISSS